jgi:hypothetical protein
MKAKRLEIIQLRLSGRHRAGLVEDIHRSATGVRQIAVRLYFNATVPTDLSVHIESEGDTGDKQLSDFGVCLAAALRDHGMVQHTVWLEDQNTSHKAKLEA